MLQRQPGGGTLPTTGWHIAPAAAKAWRGRERRRFDDPFSRRAVRPSSVSAAKKAARNIRQTRRARRHSCWGHLIIAPLWVAYQANLGTLLRTCDATGACIAVPDTPHYRHALGIGDSRALARHCCIHWIDTGKDRWIRLQSQSGWQILAVELADDAIALPRLKPATQPTVVLLGHETQGVPDKHVEGADACVEIPMVGSGASLNVAVAGSLVLYRLAGLV
jgi:tRNA (guanosine-2'-O-)-methyltransferase